MTAFYRLADHWHLSAHYHLGYHWNRWNAILALSVLLGLLTRWAYIVLWKKHHKVVFHSLTGLLYLTLSYSFWSYNGWYADNTLWAALAGMVCFPLVETAWRLQCNHNGDRLWMVRVNSTIDIRCAPEQVWRFLAIGHLEATGMAPSSEETADAAFELVFDACEGLFSDEEWYRLFEISPDRCVFHILSDIDGGFFTSGELYLRLKPAQDGPLLLNCGVEFSFGFPYISLMSIVRTAIGYSKRRALESVLRASLLKLKQALEESACTAATGRPEFCARGGFEAPGQGSRLQN